MPELPEVETVVRDLRPLLLGRRILEISRLSSLELRRPWQQSWHALLVDRQIVESRRRGKWIVLGLDNGAFLVVHLGMTGQLTVVSQEEPRDTHTHLEFRLDTDLKVLRFRDIRRFGCILYTSNQEALETFYQENELGPEPFDLDPVVWQQELKGTTRVIKAVLLDQTVVAGVGNIYADEALYVAKIHPLRRACDLSKGQAETLRKAIVEVLKNAIEHRGSTIRNYVGGSGLEGGYQNEFRAYGRTGEPCSRCQTALVVLRVGGRSSHFCKKCQPAPRRKVEKKSQTPG